jgi:1-acyl-sn-glycerol-3-phosphate acyltransferase
VRTLASIWAWLMLSLTVIVGTFIAAPLLLITWPFDRTRAVPGRFVRLCAVCIAKLNPQWSFRIHGPVPAYRPKKTVVVSNHVSNSDVFLISHLPWEMKWLAKSSLFFLPFVGWLLWIAGDVPVRRGGKESIVAAMAQLRWYLDHDMPVAIFPEGTRSETGELRDFKDGAFRLALEAGADVLPVAVCGTRDALPKHSWKFGHSRGRVIVGAPIAAGTHDDVEAHKAAARAEVERLAAELERAAEGVGEPADRAA